MKTLPRVTDIRPLQPSRALAKKAAEFRDEGHDIRVVVALLNWHLRFRFNKAQPRVTEADVARMWASVEAQPEAR